MYSPILLTISYRLHNNLKPNTISSRHVPNIDIDHKHLQKIEMCNQMRNIVCLYILFIN